MSFPESCKLFPVKFVTECIEKFKQTKGQPTTLVLNEEDCVEYFLSGFLPGSFMGLEVFRSREVPKGSIDIQIRRQK